MTRVRESRALSDWAQSVVASNGDLLAEVLRLGLERLMEAERDAYVNAAPHERTEGRRARRNGYRTRTLRTRAGQLELVEVPRTRDGGYYPILLERYQRSQTLGVKPLPRWCLERIEMNSKSEASVKFELLAPVVSAINLTESVKFYRDVLGFQIDWTWGSPPEMAAVSRDGVEIHLSADGESSQATCSRIYCFIRGVDRFAAEVRERGGEILNEVADQAYGMRDFDLDDPAGNRLCFGEPTVE